MAKKFTVLVCWFLTAFSIHAQERLWFDEINIDDGLSQPTVLCMIQDKQGFIWIGTQYGLNRYDGYQFVTYKNEILDDTSLSSNYIIDLFEDSSGTLWIATNNGLNAFDTQTNKFTRYLHDSSNPNTISNNHISSIEEDTKGNLWVGTVGGGLNLFDKAHQTFNTNPFESTSASPPMYITDLLIDEKDTLWIASGEARLRPSLERGGIFQVAQHSFELIQVYPKNGVESAGLDGVTAIFQDKQENLWFGTLGQGLLYKQEGSNEYIQLYKNRLIKGDTITSITQDHLGRIWFASQYNGLYSYDVVKNIMFNYNSTSPENSNLRDDDIVSLLIDSTGVFWVGTWTEGINKLDFDSFQFQRYLQIVNDVHAAKQDVLDINQDSSGNIWLATWESGLLKLDIESGTSSRPEILTVDVVGNVRHVFVDKEDGIWIGSNNKGLIYFDPEQNAIQSYSHDSNDKYSISNNRIIQIVSEASGNLWIATRGGGLNYFDITDEKFYTFRNNPVVENSVSDDQVNALFYDDVGLLWVGTSQGLDIFDPVSKHVISHYQGDTGIGSLLGRSINTIFQDSNGQIWIGTDKGVSRVNVSDSNDRLQLTFSWDIGFGKSQIGSVGGILDDNNGNLWISSFKYITRYNPKTQEIKNYNSSSGVLSGGYYIGSSHKDNNGNMYFGGLNGLSVFKAEEKHQITEEPQIVLTQFLLFNQPIFANNSTESILKNSIEKTEILDLYHKQNVFSIEFSALHYSSPKDNQYAYKLEGFDEQWIYTNSNNRRATYTNLDAGEYQFLMKASNNEGVWSNPKQKLIIRTHAAPWKTKTAYFIYLMFAVLTIGSFIWLRIKQVQAIKLRNEQLSLTSKLFENTSECVWLLDSELNYLTVNQGFCKVTGYSELETIGKQMRVAQVRGQNKDFLDVVFDKVKNGGRWEGEMWAQRQSEEIYPIEIVIDRITMRNRRGEISGYQYVGVFSDITLRKKAEQDLKFMAYYDKLTQLPNRTYFHTLVTSEINSSLNNNEFIVFYLDLDNFKNINDSLGHTYGDELLVTIANRFSDFSDNRYTIARLGGDEFAIMIPKQFIKGKAHAYAAQISSEILTLIRKQVVIKKHNLHTSASIGVTVYPYDGKNYEELLRNADTAMYESKKLGRNDFTLYSKKMNKAARQRLMLEDELNKAITSHEIVPYYQPKVLLDTGELYGLEILARWNHEKLGWIPPDQFIPIAEESKLINRISDQLLTQACEFLLPIIKKGIFNGRMSFNLSITQFLQGDIVTRIDNILNNCQFPAKYLEIEITESMLMGNVDRAISIMNQFKQRDISIAIDDFGTGYSSLSYLKKLPIDVLKIDISFIKDIAISSEDKNIVNSIIHLAHNLGLTVVAEGGESAEQISILKEMGCEQLQGYYFSKPLSADEYLEFLTKNEKF